MVEPTCTLYITIRVTGKSYSQTIQQGTSHTHQCSATRGTSTRAQPHRRPTQKISISLSLTRESSRVSHRLNSLHRGERYTHHMSTFTPHRGTHRFISNDTPISWAFSPLPGAHTSTHTSHGHPYPTHGHTTFHLSLREERHTHLMGTPNSWALSQADSLILCPRGCIMKL